MKVNGIISISKCVWYTEGKKEKRLFCIIYTQKKVRVQAGQKEESTAVVPSSEQCSGAACTTTCAEANTALAQPRFLTFLISVLAHYFIACYLNVELKWLPKPMNSSRNFIWDWYHYCHKVFSKWATDSPKMKFIYYSYYKWTLAHKTLIWGQSVVGEMWKYLFH